MPAAFYEFTLEQSSDFVSVFKILNPNTGKLFKFLPPIYNPNNDPDVETERHGPVWLSNTLTNDNLNFEVPDEIKVLYPKYSDAFGWLSNSYLANLPFLEIRMMVKSSSNATPIINTKTTYTKSLLENQIYGLILSTNSDLTKTTIIPPSGTSASYNQPIFEFRSNIEHNLLMNIPSFMNSVFSGKYLYDIELEYKLGNAAVQANSNLKSFVIRLLQGRFIFNTNITTT